MSIYITDKTGKRFWNTDVAEPFAKGERANLARHLEFIKGGHPKYAFVDAATARLVENSTQSDEALNDDELLAALGVTHNPDFASEANGDCDSTPNGFNK